MYKFGNQSKENLSTCRLELQRVAWHALSLNIVDFACIEGHRGKEKQNEYFAAGKSRVQWPNGKHNKKISEAFDLVPYVNGRASWVVSHCIFLAGIVLASAAMLGYKVRWGGNWDMDGEVMTDQKFQDLVHYELVGG